MILSGIHSPDDVKRLSEKELKTLAAEIRKTIIETVAKNGGHLASNLGIVELTIALHRVFSSPKDAFVFDVSHQSYTHKLLTGRYEKFATLRKKGGISGFTRCSESVHDFFDNGHASTSISQALGLLTAKNYLGDEGKAIAIIGDGALTGGMAMEALSHAGQISKNLIVILNDNQMSISANTGAISSYLSRLTMTPFYQSFRKKTDSLVDKIPNSQNHFGKLVFRIKRALKGLFLSKTLFGDLGFEYVGPLNGHNISEMESVFRRISKLNRPVVVHIRTKKGFGYSPAENDPASFHGIGPFTISDGSVEKFDTVSFTECFSRTLMALAENNPKICAITAAMAKGCGLDSFSRHFPDRFFDVGIAEEHAVTFASGLSKGGMIPVVSIYSTFFQRSVDQIIHDIALPKAHAVLVADRCGVVPSDGETHQGLFDIALMRSVPNLSILSPATEKDLFLMMDWAVNKWNGPVFIRYPKASCPKELENFDCPIEKGRGVLIKAEDFAPGLLNEECESKKILFVTTGSMFSETMQAARSVLMKNACADIYSLRFLSEIDENYFIGLCSSYSGIIFLEDGLVNGGISQYLESLALKHNIKAAIKAFPMKFFAHGNRSQIFEDAGMSIEDLTKAALSLVDEMGGERK